MISAQYKLRQHQSVAHDAVYVALLVLCDMSLNMLGSLISLLHMPCDMTPTRLQTDANMRAHMLLLC